MAGFGDILRRVRRRSAETPEPAAADPPAPPASEPPAANAAVDASARFRPPVTEPPPASEPPAANDAGDAVDAGARLRPPITEPPAAAEPAAASPVAPGNPAERPAAGARDWGEPPLRPAAGSEYAGPPEPPTLIAGAGPTTPPPSTPAGPLLPPPELAPSDFAPPELRPPELVAPENAPPELASPELAPPELAPQNAPITAPTAPAGIPDRAGDAHLPPPPGAPDDAGDAADDDAGAGADADAGRADAAASDDPMLLICPYCGRPEQRVGSRCERCNGVIVRLPVWAQRRRRNWLSRRLSWRRIIAACFIVLLILFVVWINYPFAPNPVVLFKNIQTQMTIDDSPGAWSVSGRDLRHSRNVQLGPPPPQGVTAWENKVPAPLNSEPVARRNDIYVGSAHGIYPLKESNGSLREEWEGNTPGRVTAAAAVAETSLFFGSTDHTVNAWDALNGDVRWSFPADDTVEVAPVVSGGLVYISSGRGQVYALDGHDGNLIWQEQLDSNASAAVAIHDGKLFVGDERGIFYILSARTGQERFRYRTSRAVSGSPVVSADGQRVYFASGGQLYAIDAQAREVPGLYQFKQIWAQLWLWQVPGVPRPRGQQGDIWRFTPDNPLQGISSSPALAEDDDNGHKILYAGAHDHYLYALNATHSAVDDRLLWAYEAQEAIWASPLVVKDQVIFGDVAGNVYSVDRITGELDWRIDLGAPVRIAPIVSNGLLVVRTEDGVIHGIK